MSARTHFIWIYVLLMFQKRNTTAKPECNFSGKKKKKSVYNLLTSVTSPIILNSPAVLTLKQCSKECYQVLLSGKSLMKWSEMKWNDSEAYLGETLKTFWEYFMKHSSIMYSQKVWMFCPNMLQLSKYDEPAFSKVPLDNTPWCTLTGNYNTAMFYKSVK